ncbi:MAG: FecR domain-containing protein [Pseudomonadota bacterium]
MVRETAEEIDEIAAAWAVCVDRGLTAAEAAALEAWLEGDVRRSGAYARMTWVLMSTEKADLLAAAYGEAPARTPKPAVMTRRRWMAAGGAMAASFVAAGVYLGVDRPVVHGTRIGEKKVVSLGDGSVITLNTATRLEVAYSKDRRHVRLLAGEALFDVAKDPARPFVVSVRGADVRAVGTSFTVSSLNRDAVRVLVREGVVEVSPPAGGARRVTRLAANDRAVVSGGAGPVVVAQLPPSEVDAELAWRQGRIVFRGESLAAAVRTFSRYSDIAIIIDDPALGAEQVSGVFDANDPIGFARSIALSLQVRAEIGADQVRLTR